LLHTAADGVKFFFKEDFIPPKADKLLFGLAPILCLVPVLALTAVIPLADTLCWGPSMVHHACGFAADGVTRLHLSADGSSCLNAANETVSSVSTIWPSVTRFGVCGSGEHQSAIEMAIAPLDIGLLYVFALAGQGIVGAAIAGWSSDNKFSL